MQSVSGSVGTAAPPRPLRINPFQPSLLAQTRQHLLTSVCKPQVRRAAPPPHIQVQDRVTWPVHSLQSPVQALGAGITHGQKLCRNVEMEPRLRSGPSAQGWGAGGGPRRFLWMGSLSGAVWKSHASRNVPVSAGVDGVEERPGGARCPRISGKSTLTPPGRRSSLAEPSLPRSAPASA